jgi:hypothetical protein
MKTFKTLLLIIALGVSVTALAQQPAAKPKEAPQAPTAEAPKSMKPLLLTKEQVERLADAEKTRQIVRYQLEAIQNLMGKINAEIDGMVKDFQIDLGFDPAKYERDLRLLDQQRNIFGFLPKAEPPKPATQPVKQ